MVLFIIFYRVYIYYIGGAGIHTEYTNQTQTKTKNHKTIFLLQLIKIQRFMRMVYVKNALK